LPCDASYTSTDKPDSVRECKEVEFKGASFIREREMIVDHYCTVPTIFRLRGSPVSPVRALPYLLKSLAPCQKKIVCQIASLKDLRVTYPVYDTTDLILFLLTQQNNVRRYLNFNKLIVRDRRDMDQYALSKVQKGLHLLFESKFEMARKSLL
jgi:hypothetical protein